MVRRISKKVQERRNRILDESTIIYPEKEKFEKIIRNAVKNLYNSKEYNYIEITGHGEVLKYKNKTSRKKGIYPVMEIRKNKKELNEFKKYNNIKNNKEAVDKFANATAVDFVNDIRDAGEP